MSEEPVVLSDPKTMDEWADGFSGMSNCDHSIDDGFEEALRAAPGKLYGHHAGWNFNAKVWFEHDRFHAQPWVYQSPNPIISADTLRQLMEAVNDVYGSD